MGNLLIDSARRGEDVSHAVKQLFHFYEFALDRNSNAMRPPISLPTSSGAQRFTAPDLDVTAGAYSVRGANRENNEDYEYISPDRSVFIVADGMGGHKAGEFASRFVIDALTHELNRTFDDSDPDEAIEEHVRAAFDHANCLLLEATEDNPNYYGAGTTALVALVFGDRLFVSGIGDSRAYLLRDDSFELLTLDDSITTYLLNAGVISAEEAQTHPMRNRLCAYMGMENFQPDGEFRVIRLQPEDVVLLCSDGLTDVVEEVVIQAILKSHRNSQLAARQLVQMAVENKASDDVTCVVFRVEEAVVDNHDEPGSRFADIVDRFRSLFGKRPTPAI